MMRIIQPFAEQDVVTMPRASLCVMEGEVTYETMASNKE
jgi:hypothetical protein